MVSLLTSTILATLFDVAQDKPSKKFVLHSFPLMKRTKNLGFINFLEIQILEAKQSELAIQPSRRLAPSLKQSTRLFFNTRPCSNSTLFSRFFQLNLLRRLYEANKYKTEFFS